MRQIKFRGKRLDDDKWIYGDLYHTCELTCICDWSIRPHTVEEFEVIPSTVGQFTGLSDRDGKEIFEGDIVDFGLNAVVKYHPFLCSFILDCDNREPHFNDSYSELGFMERTSKKFVVIGNIHDNPELLKGGER